MRKRAQDKCRWQHCLAFRTNSPSSYRFWQRPIQSSQVIKMKHVVPSRSQKLNIPSFRKSCRASMAKMWKEKVKSTLQPQSWPFSLLICNCRILIIQCSKNLHKLIDCFALVSCKSTSGLVSHYYQTSCIQNHKCISAQVSEKPTDATIQCCASCTVHHDIILVRSSRRVSEANMDYKTLHTPSQKEKAIRKRRKLVWLLP